MAGATDLLVVLVLLSVVGLTPPTAVVTMLILLARHRHRAPTDRAAHSDPCTAPTQAPTVVIDNFLQYPYGAWSYFHAGGLLMRAPRDANGHVLVASAHPAHPEWCDDVTPVELIAILNELEQYEHNASARPRRG
jgi:hypothetical protein